MPRSDPTPAPFRLTARAPDESTRIEVLDGNLRPVPLEQNLGEVSLQLPAGVYTVRFHQGRGFSEKLAALLPGSPAADVWLEPDEQPEFATAAPLLGTTTRHEWQHGPAKKLSHSAPLPPPPRHRGGSRLLLFLRNPFPQGDLPSGVTIHDLAGEKLFDLALEGHREMSQQWCGAHLDVDPGAYRLRRALPRGTFVEQVVFTQLDWQTQVFLMTDERAGTESQISRISILMARFKVGFQFDRPDFRWTESALRALDGRRNIPGAVRNEMLNDMLPKKFENPMLGIYAGLLHLRRRQIDVDLMRAVLGNLLGLVGPMPDVLAIGWGIALHDEAIRGDSGFMAGLRQPQALATPPLLRESWDYLLRASASEPDLIPDGSLTDRIGGRLVAGSPWVAWLGGLPAPAQPTGVTFEAAVTAEQVTPGIRAGLFHQLGGLLGPFAEGASHFTLRAGLPMLAKALSKCPEARFWLETKRFNDLERRVAYWLEPVLDPRLAPVVEAEPKVGRALRNAARQRLADETALLTELDISSTTALRTAWGVFLKLFLQPVLPDKTRLERFVEEESRGDAVFGKVLRGLRRKPSRLHHPASKRTLNLLEFACLYYRGSPAEGASAQPSEDRLAGRLEEAGFVVSEEGRPAEPVMPAKMWLQHAELQQQVIRAIERAARREALSLPPMWQLQVCPLLKEYSPGKLLPAGEKS